MATIQASSSDPSIKSRSSIYTIFPLSHSPRPRKIAMARFNFITFLAVLQRLQIPILPITWDPERNLIGGGRTGRIAEASLSLESSYAFKRIGDNEKAGAPGAEIFLPLINEMAILKHDHINGHPNIPDLEGFCWDITPRRELVNNGTDVTRQGDKFNIWPVLVFEKAKYGDLYQFAQSSKGRQLSIGDRLKLCLDVGNAIAAVQSHHIIHGDIKPQNVLVHESQSPGALVMAQVIDFSFSAWYSDDEARIPIPRSWPWYAPECDEYPDFTPLEAMKTDVFSYGMLCLWILAEQRLSDSQLCVRFGLQKAESPLELMARLKNQSLLPDLAKKLLAEETGIQAQSKLMLERFFSGTLHLDPDLRCSSIQEALNHLGIEEARRTNYPSALYLAYPDRIMRGKPMDPVELPPATDNDFNICNSLHALYSSDYRLRVSIVDCLGEITATIPAPTPLHTQLLLCYKLGFGGPIAKDDHSGACDDITIKHELSQMLDDIANSNNDEFNVPGTFHGMMQSVGYVQRFSLADNYFRDDVLEGAEATVRFEISRIEETFGLEHWIALLLRAELASIVGIKGQAQEAEKLGIGMVERSIKGLGRGHPETLNHMSSLVSIYQNLGKLEDAELLAVEVVGLYMEKYSKHSPLTIGQMAQLGRIYVSRKKLQEAEDVFTELIAIEEREPGSEFPYTLDHMEELANIFKAQGEFEKAEKLLLQVISSREASWGINSSETLTSLRSLESLYHLQGRKKEAAALLKTRSVT
ncbi:kinase-like domain-containing protein [Xylaria scruposa]|nr:kinase-like domain-containing protein [Xylaria scruposa]